MKTKIKQVLAVLAFVVAAVSCTPTSSDNPETAQEADTTAVTAPAPAADTTVTEPAQDTVGQ